MKRLLFIGIGCWVLVTNLGFAAERMRIGYSSISGAYVGIWVAHDAGYFTKEGLDDQIILIPNGTQLAQVTVAGEVDLASLGGAAAISAMLSGADFKVIGDNVNKLIFSMFARPDIKRVEDLKGKKIGITRIGTSADISARQILRQHNMDPQKDVVLLQLGAVSSIAGALKAGTIDAGMVSPPTLFLMEKLGFKEIASVTDMNLAFPNPAMVVPMDLIRKKPEVIDRFMRAYVRGVHRAKTDRDFTIKSYAKYTTVQDTAILQRAYEFYVEKIVERAPYINMAGMQNAIDEVAKTNPAAKSARPEQFIDMRFLDKLEKSGLVNELYR
ncbi:MAG TPA: ABC transporter substrate-binding protein [Candidatus Binatia bacterium]|jgi:ABC-type nitrate/sulfonate/bicarbonate transport system substrate-binding protein